MSQRKVCDPQCDELMCWMQAERIAWLSSLRQRWELSLFAEKNQLRHELLKGLASECANVRDGCLRQWEELPNK